MTDLAPARTADDAATDAHACDSAHCLSRRTMLRGAGAVTLGVAAAAALAACGGGGGDDNPGDGGGSTDAPLAKVADVPVGGAVSAEGPNGEPLLIAQPTEGTFVGYSAVCTHLQCKVAPNGDEFKCPCHGSEYALADGSVLHGPAPLPLDKVEIHVENGNILFGA